MAFVVVVVDVSSGLTATQEIAQFNDKIQNPGNPHEAVNNLRNLMDSINGGHTRASVQVTIRDTDPAVATSGTGSTQQTYNLK